METNKIKVEYPQFLQSYKPRVNELLHQHVSRELERIESTWPYSSELLPPLLQFVERDGKRVRPSLTILGYKSFKGRVDEKVFLPAISTELMHDSFIIHDDLYDHIPDVVGTRRGGEVLHLNYEEEFRKKNAGQDSNWEPSLFAKHATVAMAHVLLTMGAGAIHLSDFGPEIKAKALAYYWNIVEETWLGQGMDILSKGKSVAEVSEEEILMTECSRAGVYTVAFPLCLGAILAEADDSSMRLLSEYGRSTGLAFEIYDDVLGIFGEEKEIGKIQADLMEGKRTLLISKALENGSFDQRRTLLVALKDKNYSKEQLALTRTVLMETGALNYTTRLIENLIESAISVTDKLKISEQDKKSLKEFARFVISRKN